MVFGVEEFGYFEGSFVVGRVGKVNGEGVELGKEGYGREFVFVIEINKIFVFV